MASINQTLFVSNPPRQTRRHGHGQTRGRSSPRSILFFKASKRQRVRIKVERRSFTVFDENRAPVFRSHNFNSPVARFDDDARHLFLLNRAVRWVRKNLPGVAVTMTMPQQPEMKVRMKAA